MCLPLGDGKSEVKCDSHPVGCAMTRGETVSVAHRENFRHTRASPCPSSALCIWRHPWRRMPKINSQPGSGTFCPYRLPVSPVALTMSLFPQIPMSSRFNESWPRVHSTARPRNGKPHSEAEDELESASQVPSRTSCRSLFKSCSEKAQ